MMRGNQMGAIAALAIAVSLLAACGESMDYPPSSSSSSSSGGNAPELPNPASAPSLKTTIAGRFGVVDYPVGAAIEPASPHQRDRGRAAHQALQQHHRRKRHEARHDLAQRAGHARSPRPRRTSCRPTCS